MARFGLSAIGRDRPGIVAGISRVLADHGVNIEDSQMTILSGHFTMTLIVAPPADSDVEALRAALETAGRELGLEAVWLGEVEEGAPRTGEPTHMLSVYGADHPGIVSAVSAALAEHEVNVTDLETRLVGEGGDQPLYVMLIEVALPPTLEPAALEDALGAVGREQGVDVTLRPLEQDVL